MVEAKLRSNNICVYCGRNAHRLDEEMVCSKCENKNDEELSRYGRCDFCDGEQTRSTLIELDGEMGCSECVGTCNVCGNNYLRDEGYECEDCGGDVCGDCIVRCSVCKERICFDCNKGSKAKPICEYCVEEKENERMHKFRVGETVECIGSSKGSDGDKTYGGGGWRKGRRFIVTGITNKDICWGKISGGVYAHHLKLIDKGG